MSTGPIANIAFYRFVKLSDLPVLRPKLREMCRDFGLRGTVILAPEGINGFLAGPVSKIEEFQTILQKNPAFKGIIFKVSFSETIPFKRLLIKLKKEIIPFGKPEICPEFATGPRLLPSEFKKWLDDKKEVLILDTRNQFEIDAGTFENAVSLGINTFREFPAQLSTLPPEWKTKPVVMFCTGGIRCEKATAFAVNEGFKKVYQLEGGILNYFKECGQSHYRGECFVFDERTALDAELEPHISKAQK